MSHRLVPYARRIILLPPVIDSSIIKALKTLGSILIQFGRGIIAGHRARALPQHRLFGSLGGRSEAFSLPVTCRPLMQR